MSTFEAEHRNGNMEAVVWLKRQNKTENSQEMAENGEKGIKRRKWKKGKMCGINGLVYFVVKPEIRTILCKIKHTTKLTRDNKVLLFAATALKFNEYNGRASNLKRWNSHYVISGATSFDKILILRRQNDEKMFCFFIGLREFKNMYKLFERPLIHCCTAFPGNSLVRIILISNENLGKILKLKSKIQIQFQYKKKTRTIFKNFFIVHFNIIQATNISTTKQEVTALKPASKRIHTITAMLR